ncbi:MAG: MGMT family protein [bacterium]|nr:MGMT family protein [bacterium]
MTETFYQKVYKLTKMIPKGKVATYGQIAALAGSPRSARIVGYALHIMPPDMYNKIPWQRVINRHGMISTTCQEHTAKTQAKLLRKEKIKVTEKENIFHIDLNKYLWEP